METHAYTAEQVLTLAVEGRFSKAELAEFLATECRKPFLEACARIEKKYTEDCTAKGEPCLESGCSVEGETCLQPLLHAGSGYYKACAEAWLPIFRDVKNRADMFQH
jgi:hypothetical protein